MRRLFLALLPALLTGLTLYGADTPKSAFDKPTLEAYIRHLFVLPAQLTVTVNDPKPAAFAGFKEVRVRIAQGAQFQDVNLFVSNDGKQIVQGNFYDIAKNPFKPDLDKLKPQYSPALGTAGAPVAIVLFTDLQCPYCKNEAEMLRKNLIQNYPTQVRLYFKNFPLTGMHPWAKAAAAAGRCVFAQKNETFWEYHDWVFAHQESLKPETLKNEILEWAKGVKDLDAVKLGACIDSKSTEAEVDAEIQQGQDLGITGTPTMFVNGRRIAQTIEWPNLKNIIDLEIEYQKTAKNAGDDCACEVKLDIPGMPAPKPVVPPSVKKK
jgi:protein-disulfide isomerase